MPFTQLRPGDGVAADKEGTCVSGHHWVPIDDHTTMVWNWNYTFGEVPFTQEEREHEGGGNSRNVRRPDVVAGVSPYTGDRLPADRALATGLVSEVVPDDRLEAAAQPYIDEMLAASPMGLRLTKEGLNLAIDAPGLEAAMAIENPA